jgi:hypothetical protein
MSEKEFSRDVEILESISGVIDQHIQDHLRLEEKTNPSFKSVSLTEAVKAAPDISVEEAWKSGFLEGLRFVRHDIIQFLVEEFNSLNEE